MIIGEIGGSEELAAEYIKEYVKSRCSLIAGKNAKGQKHGHAGYCFSRCTGSAE